MSDICRMDLVMIQWMKSVNAGFVRYREVWHTDMFLKGQEAAQHD